MFLRPEPESGWYPTHVQVTILQARGLRAKGKHGTSDAYTLIQVGREKYSTSVVEKTPGSPEWKEECSFELSPGALERGENCELQLTIMHRALIGMDQFLGKVSMPLQDVYQEGRSQMNQWYKLHSKPGKKEKDRGEIQVSIQFTRNNLTASMFDLSIKDKPKTPFGKLKDKLKVKKHSQFESSSAIVPSSIGRLDSDDEDGKKSKSKAAAFFKGRLRKSSLTRSNTSLGSDSTISSTSGTVPTSAGVSIVLPDVVVKKPATRNSSLSTEPTVKDQEASPRMTHKRAFSDEVSKLKLFPEPKSVQNLKPKGSPISKSSVCINGSHVYTEVPAPKPNPALEKSAPASMSLQNIVKKAEEVADVMRGPGHSSAKSEHKPTGPAVEEQHASSKPTPQPMPRSTPVQAEAKPVQITSPMVFTEDVSKVKSQEVKSKEEKSKVGLQHGTGKTDPANKSLAEPKPHVLASSEERGKVSSWFGSKDAKENQQKPSLDVSPQVETSSSASSHYSPCLFVPPTSLVDASVLPRTNLHSASPSGVFGSLSASNPFLNSLQNNPFFEDLLSERLLNTSSPTHFFSSFPSGSIATSEAAERGSSLVEEHSPSEICHSREDLTASKYHGERGNVEAVGDHRKFRLTQSSSSEPPVVLGWEEQFDALASSRLQPSNGNAQQTEDHDATSDAEKYPLSSPFAKRETGTLYEGDEWHNLQSDNSNLDTCLPVILNNDVGKVCELSPLPTNVLPNISPPYISSPGSTGLDKLSTNTFKDLNTFNFPVVASSENRVATVQPRLLMEQNMFSVGQEAGQDSPILTKDSAAMASIGECALDVVEIGIDIHNTQVSKELVEQVSTEHNPERIRIEQVMPNEKDESIIKEQAISVDIGSAAPPKPPRLMNEAEDNYKQTSHQDTTGKQTENPEEHKLEQNMGVSKQSVSPVACCPVIEIRSPVLEAFTEDTQSTTKGLLTNLREENNDFSKLGAVNGEHLLDVNEVTPTEQFRTCPSNVSLDTDLSSPHEGSDKLELMSHGPTKPLSTTLGGSKQGHNDFNFQKPMPLSKPQKECRSELSSQSKKGDQTDFWSALEEQTPSSLIGLDAKQNVPTNWCDSAPSGGRIVSLQNSEQKPEQEQNRSEDVLVLHGAEFASPPPNVLQEHKLESDAKTLTHDGQHGYSRSQLSSWSADIIVDFKNEDFWRTDSGQLDQNHGQNLPSPGNPFSPVDKTPFLSHKNPFIVEHTPSSQSSESSLQEDTSFKDLHSRAALKKFPSAVPPTDVKAPYLHDSQPLAFSTPSLATAPNPKPSNFPSPITLLTTPGATTTTNTHTATLSGLHSPVAGGVTTAAPPILPLETQTADKPFMTLKTSPHPVKPISATLSESTPEKKTQRPAITTALSSGLEMLKSVTGGQNPNSKKQDERLKDLGLPDQAAKYYHLTHDELIQMLLQREDELSRKDNHVRELEDYIDKLLVRIMDQAPTLLQAPLETNQ